MWSSGGLEGGPGRGRGSKPPAPPPSRHALGSRSQGARGNLEVVPQQRLRGHSDSPQALPGQCPPGRGPEGFGDLKDFKHRKHLGRWRGTLNPLSPRFLITAVKKPGRCPHSPPLPLTRSFPTAAPQPQGLSRDPHTLALLSPLHLQLGLNCAPRPHFSYHPPGGTLYLECPHPTPSFHRPLHSYSSTSNPISSRRLARITIIQERLLLGSSSLSGHAAAPMASPLLFPIITTRDHLPNSKQSRLDSFLHVLGIPL